MRRLAILTTTAAMALAGAANAQSAHRHHAQVAAATPTASETPAAASSSYVPQGPIQSALVGYVSYQNDVTELRAARITSDAELEAALTKVGRHNRDDLTRGFIAYGALTAEQSPAFAQGVRDAAAYYGRDAVIWAITADPSYARGLRGGAEATRLALNEITADSARIISVADRYHEMAYTVQRMRWANVVAPGQAARLQRVRSLGAPGGYVPVVDSSLSPRLSVAPLSLQPESNPTGFGGRNFWDAVGGDGAQTVEVAAQVSYQWRLNPTRSMAVDRMTSIAALQALDAVNDHQSAVTQLLNDPRSRNCLEMAQLQLYQCMSAAHFRYENAFCVGEHGLRDVGTCIGAVAEPDTATMAPITATPTPATGRRS